MFKEMPPPTSQEMGRVRRLSSLNALATAPNQEAVDGWNSKQGNVCSRTRGAIQVVRSFCRWWSLPKGLVSVQHTERRSCDWCVRRAVHQGQVNEREAANVP